MTMEVTIGNAWAPIAAIVATSPAQPPAPEASLALKLITQAGAGGSSVAVARFGSWGSDEGWSGLMKRRPSRDSGAAEASKVTYSGM